MHWEVIGMDGIAGITLAERTLIYLLKFDYDAG